MKPGDLIKNTDVCWVEPDEGYGVEFPSGTIFIITKALGHHCKVIAPNGMFGWIRADCCEVISEGG